MKWGAWALALMVASSGAVWAEEQDAASQAAAQAAAQTAAQAGGAAQAAAQTAAQAGDAAQAETLAAANATQGVNDDLALSTGPELPCPSFWSVQPNPSVENSLSYVHDSGDIAVSVTYIADQSGSEVSAETFARVAAEQMNCTMPIHSNLIGHAWSFICDDGELEAIVYGDEGDLVLLSIAGRNEKTETYLDGFISFLSYQASRR